MMWIRPLGIRHAERGKPPDVGGYAGARARQTEEQMNVVFHAAHLQGRAFDVV
jgi:hypothetical protein